MVAWVVFFTLAAVESSFAVPPSNRDGPGGVFRVKVDPATGMYVDEHGARRMFHGVNVVSKLHPFLPSDGAFDWEHSMGEQDMQFLQSIGMNVVRLGVMWTAVMPSPGVVNTTYLTQVTALIRKLWSHEIYTIVDAHQDVLNPYMCGEGIPTWALDQLQAAVGFNRSDPTKAFPKPLPLNLPLNADGTPNVTACRQNAFGEYYNSFESEATWHSLYSVPESMNIFGDSWAAVASAMKDVPGVLGYELLNEPWLANKLPSVLSDQKTLGPLYSVLHERIREKDNETIIMFEPLMLESYLKVTTDFNTSGIGGRAYADRSVFAYHNYCADNSEGSPKPWLLCEIIVNGGWSATKKNLAKVQLGGFLTEFGAVGNDETSVKLLNLQTQQADALFQSWAYWSFKGFDDITTADANTESFYNPDGTLQMNKVKALSRTFAKTVAGHPNSMSFDPSTAIFMLSLTTLKIDATTTEVFVPEKYHYPQGYKVTVEPSLAMTWDARKNGIVKFTLAQNIPVGTTIKITITPN